MGIKLKTAGPSSRRFLFLFRLKFRIDAHGASGAGDDFLRLFQVVGVQIFHLLRRNFLHLLLRELRDLVLRLLRTFLDIEFLENKA